MAKRTTRKKPIRKVTSAEEQSERAELQRYRASVRRLQEISRLVGVLSRLMHRVNNENLELAKRIARNRGFELVEAVGPAEANG